jgi:hypothetical protein
MRLKTRYLRRSVLGAAAAVLAACGATGGTGQTTPTATESPTAAATISAANLPPSRVNMALAFNEATGRLVLFGGRTPMSPTRLADTWTWDGHVWTRVTAADGPSARELPPMGYDPRTHSVLLFGGLASGLAPLTWSFDGSSWRQLSPSHEPVTADGTFQGRMAFDPATGGVVIEGNSGQAGGTFTWDGNDWSVPGSGACPQETSCRSGAAFAFDPSSNQLIMAGGHAQDTFPDTDAWNGQTWRKVSVLHSAPRDDMSAALDSARGVITATTCSGDTWEFARGDWQELHPAHTPPSMRRFGSCSVAYDPVRKIVVLLGVADGPTPGGLSMWAWNGTDWQALHG